MYNEQLYLYQLCFTFRLEILAWSSGWDKKGEET